MFSYVNAHRRSEQDGKKQRGCGAVRVKSSLVL